MKNETNTTLNENQVATEDPHGLKLPLNSLYLEAVKNAFIYRNKTATYAGRIAMIDIDYLSHEKLESLAERAEDYLNDRNVELISHSYAKIVSQAIYHGFAL